ncbi:hypothetical protein MMC25_002522 [Agyrium rufum]|nr:hypothetical protein [Agyrium rufum]
MGDLGFCAGTDPMDAGKRLLPVVIDGLAFQEPAALYAEFPIMSVEGTFTMRRVNYREFANSINGTAWWLEKEIGKGHDFETVTYIDPQSPAVTEILAVHPMRSLRIPSLDKLLTENYPHYPYDKTYDEAAKDPVVCLHTSGSTGLPKPVVLNHAFCAGLEIMSRIPTTKGYESVNGKMLGCKMFSVMPFFHAGGFYLSLVTAVLTHMVIVFPPPGPPSVEVIANTIEAARPDLAFLPPSIIEDIGQNPKLLEKISCLGYIMCAGGAISKASGDALFSKIRIVNNFGATEFGFIPLLLVDTEDWNYIHPHESGNVEFRPQGDGLYELVLVRAPDLKDCSVVFHVFPELDEWHTKDLFSPHPSKAGLWTHCGRSDDIIVFLNGEKTNPISMEQHLQSHPEVRSALIVGTGHFEAAALIELNRNTTLTTIEKARMIEAIWPVMEQANSECPAHAKVSRSHVLFVDPTKPMARAGKGTVQRKATISLYLAEIDALYADAEFANAIIDLDSKLQFRFSGSGLEPLEAFVHRVVEQITSWDVFDNGDDFFARGMDSLQIIQIVRYLKMTMVDSGAPGQNLAPSTVYNNPSVTKLAMAISELCLQYERSKESKEQIRMENMAIVLQRYAMAIEATPTKIASTRAKQDLQVVILTGSTGALGSYILEELLASSSISRIYCLNRSKHGKERQTIVNKSRGLTTEFDPKRVIFLPAVLSEDRLGVSDSAYTSLLRETSLVIHNAWQVDFNLPLSAYEDTHVKGVSNFISFSSASLYRAKILFISSIGSVGNWPSHHPNNTVPEEIISDFSVPLPMGYAESKHVSERLLSLAHDKYGTPISIIRVGQIAGPVKSDKGLWNKAEWLPSLIISSKYLGMLPDSLGSLETIDWIPIDLLSTIVTGLALVQDQGTSMTDGTSECSIDATTVYHAVNPNLAAWSTIVPTAQEFLGSTTKIVPLAAWIQQLKASADSSLTEDDFAKNPAPKLLDFYQSLIPGSVGTTATQVRLGTQKTERTSAGLHTLGSISPDWMRLWMGQWFR